MKSIQIKKYGGSDVVEVNKTAPVLSISSGKILVNVKATGVNPSDWKFAKGCAGLWRDQLFDLSLI
jgi:NADPH:quinone reductase-like Zn-dependent oxidoreductase